MVSNAHFLQSKSYSTDMKHTFLLAILALSIFSADAQVSVRRTSRKTSEQKEVTAPKAPTQAERKAVEQAVVEKRTMAEQTPVVQKKSAEEKRNITTRREAPSTVEGYSMRQQISELNQQRDNYGSRWQHVVYRELDMNIDENAVLYYPEVPTDGLTNFFTVLMNAFIKGDLKAYEYLDGREMFDDAHIVKVQDILQTHDIDPSDIPSYQVLSYYIKEQWEVDKNTTQYGRKVLAVCPILHRPGDYGGITRYPMFWVRYDDLRPFIKTQMVTSAGMNTAVRHTMDDYFTLALYRGTLYKVQNPRGLTLQQQYPDEAVRKAKIEEMERILKNGPSADLTFQPKENPSSLIDEPSSLIDTTSVSPSSSRLRRKLVEKDQQRSGRSGRTVRRSK